MKEKDASWPLEISSCFGWGKDMVLQDWVGRHRITKKPALPLGVVKEVREGVGLRPVASDS